MRKGVKGDVYKFFFVYQNLLYFKSVVSLLERVIK